MSMESDKQTTGLQRDSSSELSEYDKRRNTAQDRREGLKTWASVLSAAGTVCIPLVLLFANHTIQQKSELRNIREVALQLQSQREESEAQMKASMFGKLLDKYQSSQGLSDPLQKIFYLELLVANFGDSLNLSPIVNDLSASVFPSEGVDRAKIPIGVYDRLRTAIRETGSRQMSMLANVGAVLDVETNQGKPFTILIQNCKEGDQNPISHYLTFNLVDIQDRNGEPAGYMNAFYWDSNWSNSEENERREPIRRNFFVESVDLPLIDNLPLREGVRLAIRSKERISPQANNTFELVAFTQEYSSVRDKPTARQYVDFLTKSPIGQGLDKNTRTCYKNYDPIDIREIQVNGELAPGSAERKYFLEYIQPHLSVPPALSATPSSSAAMVAALR